MYNVGLVVGKFWPPHNGHLYLIDTARAHCRKLYVGVVATRGQHPSGYQRIDCLKEIYENDTRVSVILMDDKELQGRDRDSPFWAKYACQSIRTIPNAVFTSEEYGDPWAAEITKIGQAAFPMAKEPFECKHIMVDLDRTLNPISGTMVRADPLSYWKFMADPVKQIFAKKFAFVGGESCGKTTISQHMATVFNGAATIEAGRTFVEQYGVDENNRAIWSYILRDQPEREKLAARHSRSGLVFCDTDLLLTCVWYQRWVGVDEWYKNILYPRAVEQAKTYEHYILLSHEGVPWVDDGSRSEEENRDFFTYNIERLLTGLDLPYTKVEGGWDDRTAQVSELITKLTTI